MVLKWLLVVTTGGNSYSNDAGVWANARLEEATK